MAIRCRRFVSVVYAGASVITACGSDESGRANGGGGAENGESGAIDASQLPYAPCPEATGVGRFEIDLLPEYTSVGGQVFDGVTPSDVATLVQSEGDCRLLRPPNLLCESGCPSETCGEGNQCVPKPVAHDLGTVTIEGLVAPIQMRAGAATANYAVTPGVRVPHPGFAPGADLLLSTSGGDYEPIELRGWGVSPFQMGPNPITVAGGAATSLEWGVPDEVGPARVHVSLNIDNHGSSEARIDCDFADTGSGQIPAALIEGLFAEGTSGGPTLQIARRTATSTQIPPGCVDLLVASSPTATGLDVTVAGLITCDDSSPCPEGQTCDTLEHLCE